MQTIDISRLALVLVPAAAVVLIQWRWSLTPKTSSYGLARMVIQLILIGYLLNHIFAVEHYAYVLIVLSVMLLVSSWIALRSVPGKRLAFFAYALLATFCVNMALLALITQWVLLADPWYLPRLVIPLAGMVFAVGMNAISQFVERYISELDRGTDNIVARNTAYQATLISTINSLFAVGLVSLPGMMTGQILSGVSPLIAVRYQIMVMLMLFASSGLTSALFYELIKSKIPNKD